jgi:hypothetical protein
LRRGTRTGRTRKRGRRWGWTRRRGGKHIAATKAHLTFSSHNTHSNPRFFSLSPHSRHLETSIQRRQFRASAPSYGGGLFGPSPTTARGGLGQPSDDEEEDEDDEDVDVDVLAAHSFTLEGLRRRGDYCEEMAYDSELDRSD